MTYIDCTIHDASVIIVSREQNTVFSPSIYVSTKGCTRRILRTHAPVPHGMTVHITQFEVPQVRGHCRSLSHIRRVESSQGLDFKIDFVELELVITVFIFSVTDGVLVRYGPLS